MEKVQELTHLILISAMKLFLVALISLTSTTLCHSQTQSQGTNDETIQPASGVYLTFEDFITNSPIAPETILSEIDPYDADFYIFTFRAKKVEFVQDNVTKTFSPPAIWGYCDGKGIYINRLVFPANLFERSDVTPHHFARISFLGELSLIYFIKALPAQSQQYSFQPAKDKPVEFILDSKDGQIYKSTLKNLELLIAEDEELAEEFKKQTKDKDIKLYVFLRKYNARHPFKFRSK